MQLDESTLFGNEALLLAYFRFIKEEEITQELLFARLLETDTKGESIFRVLEGFFNEKEIPLTNIVTVATDGAPSMVIRHRGFLAYLMDTIPNLMAIHCVIYRQHLVVENLSDRLHCSLQYVITAINKIRSNSLSNNVVPSAVRGKQ